MREVWELVPEFKNYVVSNLGLVANDKTGRILRQTRNQHGVAMVGMMREGRQYKRSVPRIVANAFLPTPPSSRFNSLIHKDGNQGHNWASNLAWRPLGFTWDYMAQFRKSYPNRINEPIEDLDTGETFENSWAAATRHGLLERAVVASVLNPGTRTFPTDQQFGLIGTLDTL